MTRLFGREAGRTRLLTNVPFSLSVVVMATTDQSILNLYRTVLGSDDRLFWVLQLFGWTGISLLTYLSLSVPYDQYEFAYLAHNVSQSAVGLVLSIPLRPIFRSVWGWHLLQRLSVVIGAAILSALLWSAIRLSLFMWMTGERGLWPDFGGWLFPSLFVFFTWAALYHGIKYYQLLQKEREALLRVESLQRQEALKLARAESDARQAQLALLRYQLNPHFLFNTLNSVNALINKGEAVNATSMISKLSDFFRHSLRAEPETEVPISEEIATTELYLEIERIRFADRLTVDVEIDESAVGGKVPSMILQPLVENALKHAIGVSEAGGSIRISATRDPDGTLRLSVEDTGSDCSVNQPRDIQQGSGLGLDNTRARLQAFYGPAGVLEVLRSDLGGYAVAVKISGNHESDLTV
jgi:two-component system LytT family sensor kinase